jgi:hypothetical protein
MQIGKNEMVLTIFESCMDDIVVKSMMKLEERSVDHIIRFVPEEFANTAM